MVIGTTNQPISLHLNLSYTRLMYNEEPVRLSLVFPGGSERSTPPNPQATPRKAPGNPQASPSIHRTDDRIVIQLNRCPDSYREDEAVITLHQFSTDAHRIFFTSRTSQPKACRKRRNVNAGCYIREWLKKGVGGVEKISWKNGNCTPDKSFPNIVK